MTNEANDANERERRSRRAVVRDGVVALVVLFVVGALVMVPGIQRQLGRTANARLVGAGIDARIDFHGQDGTLRCVDLLADPDEARRVAGDVEGVRSVSVDKSCLVPAEPQPGDTLAPSSSTASTLSPSDTVPLETVPPESVAPDTSAPDTVPIDSVPADSVPVDTSTVKVLLVDGTFTLEGTVASDEQHTALRTAAQAALDPANVTDRLTVDTSLALGDPDVSTMTDLIAAMPMPLSSAELGWGPSGVVVRATYVDDAARATFEAATTAAGITPDLSPRPVATAAAARAVQDELNALVVVEPFVFGRGSTVVSSDQLGLLQRVAGIAKRFAGVTVEVQGHTDSEGDPVRNVTLSEVRAGAVADGLVQWGVPSAEVTSKGFGEAELITDENGVEIPEKSRRVVFGVTVND